MLHRRYAREYQYAGTSEIRKLSFDGGNRRAWGGDEPQAPTYVINQPSTPAAPTAAQTAEEYAKALPIYYETAMKYQPLMAQLEKQTNEQLYPQTAGLQEQIATQAAEGISGDLPSWYKTNVEDTLKSQLGRNLVYNPQAQEHYGLATQQAYQDYGNYWRNLALSAAGRQQLAASPNLMSSYTPAAQMANTATNYGNYSGAYSSMYGSNLNYNANLYNSQASNYSNPWANMAGSIAGGIGSGIGTGIGYKMWGK